LSETLLTVAALVLLGVAVGAYGTLIGAGGGFVLTPILILLYPDQSPEVLTALSLGVVFVNALSGTAGYAHRRRIDYVAGAIFAASTAPGAVAGVLLVGYVPRDYFEAAFGALLLAIAVWLAVPHRPRLLVAPPSPRYLRRLLTDAHGDTYRYSFDPVLGAAIGLGVGLLSSFFGIGGGIILVPVMIFVLRFPAYIATATSTFTLLFTSGIGASVHLLQGNYAGVVTEELALGLGVIVGAQAGVLISDRLARHQTAIVRLLSVAIGLVGLRLLLGALL
jgi:uncharacterized membrane protein YfcA